MNLKLNKWHFIGVASLIVFGVFGFYGLEFSSSDTFCGVCHYHESFTEPWHASAHYQADVTCSDCHIGHTVSEIVPAKIVGAKDAVYFLGSDIDYDRIEVYNRVDEEKCIACHRAYGKSNVTAASELPFDIDGGDATLRYEHEIHISLAEETCAKCHNEERNFNALNYMRCTSCHEGLTHKTQIYDDTHIPTADSCSVCHNGRRHIWGDYAEGLEDDGVFFYNDCTARTSEIAEGVAPADSNCERCHPDGTE